MAETKIAPTEPKSREQREARVAASKKLIDNTTRVKVKGIGKAVNIKTVKARALGTVRQRSDEGACSWTHKGVKQAQ